MLDLNVCCSLCRLRFFAEEEKLKMKSAWLLTAVVALFILWLIKYIMSQPKNLPPGPTILPLCRDVWKLIRGRTEPLALLSSWAEDYGEIVSFYVGTKVFVVLNSYQVIAEAFRHPDLQDRPKSQLMLEIFGSNNGIFFANGEVWKEQRKFILSVFRSLGVGKKTYEDTVATEMAQLSAAIKEKKGTPFDPNTLFGRAISNIIFSVVFGTQYKYDDAEFQHILDTINSNFRMYGGGGALLFLNMPGVSKIPFGNMKILANNFRNLHTIYMSQIENHVKSLDSDNPKDFIDQYLNKLAETKDENSAFNKTTLAACIGDLFAAGTETTTTTLKWGSLYMMAYPEIQSRVQDELDHVIGRDRLPRLDDIKDLPYTSAVLLEIQRKGAIVALGPPHVAAADVMIQGFKIPKGATIVPNFWKVLNSEKLWKDPDAFKPERFLNKDGQLITREELIFFSTGRRVCLGEQLARMEIFLGFTSLLHQFTFNKPDDSPPLSFKGVLGLTRNTTPYMTCAIPRE